MPKLDGGALGTAFGYQIDKMTDTVGFEDSTHTYFDLKDGSRYISCTQLIHKYVPEYDEKWWSQYKALQRLSGDRFNKYKSQLLQNKKITEEILFDLNITEEELKSEQLVVLKEWDQKRKESCERGERIHKEWEDKFYENKNNPVKQFGVGGKLDCYKGKWKLQENGIYPEFMISFTTNDGYLKTVGQADLIICDNGEVTIVDHKTNAKIEKNGFFNSKTKTRECLKFPLNHIENSSYWIYTLQMSLYGAMIEYNYPKLKVKKLILNHIDHDGVQTLLECPYLKEDVERMLLHYRKENKKKLLLEKDKPIVW